MTKLIQIVSFDVPYPPNYGGAIDVFYKLKTLNELGLDIILHTFEYGRGIQDELKKYCENVFYYKRDIVLKSQFSRLPFIVKTRDNNLLKKRLLSVTSPILFEGLHTTFLLKDPDFKNILKIVRTHNIEHNYYSGLAFSEKKIWKKIFLHIESIKLKKYESILNFTDFILSISPSEQKHFTTLYGEKSIYVPVFSEMHFNNLSNEEDFVLWHGDLKVSDNVKSVLFAIEAIKNTSYKLIIASSFKPTEIDEVCKNSKNIFYDSLENDEDLDLLLSKAKVNLLFTYQSTGIKLKLINALVKSRFVIVNNLMIDNTGLESLCIVVNSVEEVKNKLELLMNQSFDHKQRDKRKDLLKPFDLKLNAQKIINLFDH